jgi:hypothetical protein
MLFSRWGQPNRQSSTRTKDGSHGQQEEVEEEEG